MFVIVGVQPFWQQVVVGAALIAAVHVDQRRRGEYAGALDAMRNDRTVHKIIIEC